ncbi:MAG: hypothetical protein FJ077_03105 [Cyanobacteria bacterium K_DeepCast_35m_m2_023]|nr:hypothetical protein [Cyanobacteria bacterium K_DeepCast_35m_m2_023]
MEVIKGLLELLLLPLRAPLLLLLFGISTYLGIHWSFTQGQPTETTELLGRLFWSIDCLHAVLVVFICTMPELLLRRVSALMAASRVVSLVISLLIVTVGGLYMLHLNVLANVLILASGVLLARLDLLRAKRMPPPWIAAVALSVLVLFGAALGRHLAMNSLA